MDRREIIRYHLELRRAPWKMIVAIKVVNLQANGLVNKGMVGNSTHRKLLNISAS
jgi:hypothetical protein